ncbi:MAG: NDP-sugar synthase [Dehalococcoidia bacterium]|nr:NDP-sugar synthase [Dehalococcoidia bacterium]
MAAATIEVMRAIVLAGGEGTRLRPLTWRTPKPLVPLLNRPLVARLLAHLARHGFDDITLALTRRTTAVENALGGGSALGRETGTSLRLRYAYEDTPLGSGGAIAAIAGGWAPPLDTFLVCNGDIVADLDLTAMLAAHRARSAELTISLFEVEDPTPFGVADLVRGGPDEGRIRRFVEKPRREDAPSRSINSGFWLFEPSLLADMDASTFNRVEDVLFPRVATSGRTMYGFPHGPYWRDVGNAAALLAANLDLVRAETPAGVLLGEGVVVAPDARIVAPAVIGAGCTIGAGTLVEGSVLWDGVVIGPDATVRGSIVASGVTIGPGAILNRAIVAHEAKVVPGAHLVGVAIEPAKGVSA